MTIVRGSVRAGQFSGLGALSMGQRDSIINAWTDAKKLLPAVLTLQYDTKSLKDAAFAVDQAIPAFRAGTMKDDVFGAKITAVMVSIGDIVTADGTLVIDAGGADADKINKFLNAVPNMKGKVTVTGDKVGFSSSILPPWAWSLLAVALVVGGYQFIKPKR